MKSFCRQRGMTIGWILVIVAALLAFMSLVVAIQHQWASYTHALDQQGYDRGKAEALKSIGDRDNKALQAAIKERNQAQDKLDVALADNVKKQSLADDSYRKGKSDAKKQYDMDLNAIKSGALVLRGHSEIGVAAVGGLRNPALDKDKPPERGPGSAGTGDDRLSQGDSGMVLWVASEANRLRNKVTALIAIVKGDRLQINGAWNDDGHPALQLAQSLR